MKENIKIFLIALILGMVVAFFLSYKFKEPIAYALNPEATILYVGSYNNIDTATSKQRNYPNSIIYEEEGIYKIVIGIFGDATVLDLMKSYFHDQVLNFYEEKMQRLKDNLWQNPLWRGFIHFLQSTGIMKIAKKHGMDKKVKQAVVKKIK